MSSSDHPWVRVTALAHIVGAALALVVVTLLVDYGWRHAPHRPPRQWQAAWAARSRRAVRWPVGTELITMEFAGAPAPLAPLRDTLVLLRSDGAEGVFEQRRAGAKSRLVTLRMHPDVARTVPTNALAAASPAPAAGPLTWVRVPAGGFDCVHTFATVSDAAGRKRRIDEWWAPNVPVPVQRWVRALGDSLVPPRAHGRRPRGTEWSVLAEIRQP